MTEGHTYRQFLAWMTWLRQDWKKMPVDPEEMTEERKKLIHNQTEMAKAVVRARMKNRGPRPDQPLPLSHGRIVPDPEKLAVERRKQHGRRD